MLKTAKLSYEARQKGKVHNPDKNQEIGIDMQGICGGRRRSECGQ